jgi:hypothetical protein
MLANGQKPKEKPKVFISYAHEDLKEVQRLYEMLKKADCSPWIDKKNLLPGQKWKYIIKKAIKSSDFFLACFSKKSVSKIGFFQTELKEAYEILMQYPYENIYLIPVRLEECEMPEEMQDHNWVNLFEAEGFTQLLKAIQEEWKSRRIALKRNKNTDTSNHELLQNERLQNIDLKKEEFVKSEVLKYFMDNGLHYELKYVIESAFDSITNLNKTKKFISGHSVLDVLMQLRYDPSDSVYVVSRNDRASGFWTQPRKRVYINFLKTNAEKTTGYINQVRIIVFDESAMWDKLPDDDIIYDLEKLHNTNTFFSLPSSKLVNYQHINELIFGFTLSKKNKYAIIPIPGPDPVGNQKTNLDDIGNLLKLYDGYDVTHGPMRAIITADRKYVNMLISEMDTLLKDDMIYRIK